MSEQASLMSVTRVSVFAFAAALLPLPVLRIMDKYDPQKHVVRRRTGYRSRLSVSAEQLARCRRRCHPFQHLPRPRRSCAKTNIAQMVNVLQAMILTDGPRMLLTPTYHVFSMYKPFRGATAFRVALASSDYRLATNSVPAVHAAAAPDPNGKVHIAIVNLDPHRAAQIDLRFVGAVVGSCPNVY